MKTPGKRTVTLAAIAGAALALAAMAAFTTSGLAREAPTSISVPEIRTELPLAARDASATVTPDSSGTAATSFVPAQSAESPWLTGDAPQTPPGSPPVPPQVSPAPPVIAPIEQAPSTPPAVTGTDTHAEEDDREVVKPNVRDEDDDERHDED